ncbi:hypothetical protein [Snodgrassella gandavensis]|uniref:hypothetical protein n=1 Tax=Snodgrassella gandavensis TaxID=2946698 RepID=UPI001EF53E7A|nr:hypothetical protein [Snodgrassella gandavensis]
MAGLIACHHLHIEAASLDIDIIDVSSEIIKFTFGKHLRISLVTIVATMQSGKNYHRIGADKFRLILLFL